MQNLIDSHDTPRVATMIVNAGNGLMCSPERCDYDVNEALSPQSLNVFQDPSPRPQQRQLQRMVALFQMVYVGPPMIYYGTEAGMWGGDDPCNRMPMVWPEKTLRAAGQSSQPAVDQADTVEFDRALHDYYRMACHLRRAAFCAAARSHRDAVDRRPHASVCHASMERRGNDIRGVQPR